MKHYLTLGLALSLVPGLASSAMSAPVHVRYSQHAQIVDPDHAFLKSVNHRSEWIVDHVSSLGYEVYGPTGLFQQLDRMGIDYAPVVEKTNETTNAQYPTAEQSVQQMQDLQKQYPDLIQLIEIGKSIEGRSLMFARVTAPAANGTKMEARPEFKYVANMHGDEIVGREMMVKLIADLASNYGKDQRITKLMDSVQIYIMPSMNPDGATHRVRFNADGADLNRSFPDFTSDNVNTTDNREPEVQAMMKFEAKHHFKLSANFHGGSEVVNYPWDTTADPHPQENLVRELSLDYAKRVPYLYNSTEFEHGITNGYAWYEVDGGMQDWSSHWYGDLQVTIEVTTIKWPSYSTVEGTYQANRDALLAFIEDISQVP